MTHTIKLPIGWQFQDELHTYLWKRFPLDSFKFIGVSELQVPEYVKSILSDEGERAALASRGEDEGTLCDEIAAAVQEFLCEAAAA